MLKQRVHAVHRSGSGKRTVGIEIAFRGCRKRHVAFREHKNAQERKQNRVHDQDGHVVHRRSVLARANAQRNHEQRDDEGPEHQRTRTTRPQARQLVEPSKVAGGKRALLQHVQNGVVTREETVNQNGAANEQGCRNDHGQHSTKLRKRGGAVAFLLPFRRARLTGSGRKNLARCKQNRCRDCGNKRNDQTSVAEHGHAGYPSRATSVATNLPSEESAPVRTTDDPSERLSGKPPSNETGSRTSGVAESCTTKR